MNNKKQPFTLTLRDLFKTGIKENYEFALSVLVFELFYSSPENREHSEEIIALIKTELQELLDTDLIKLMQGRRYYRNQRFLLS